MRDRELVDLYDVKAITLRQQVKRNRTRFPKDFMFQLSVSETRSLLSQNVIATVERWVLPRRPNGFVS
jgi:hypothetical protein